MNMKYTELKKAIKHNNRKKAIKYALVTGIAVILTTMVILVIPQTIEEA